MPIYISTSIPKFFHTASLHHFKACGMDHGKGVCISK